MRSCDASRPLERIGIDARMLSPRPTGVGNYIAGLLEPLCEAHPETRFFLYSNAPIGFASRANVVVRESGLSIGPLWMSIQLPRALAADQIDVFWGANGVTPIAGPLPPTVVTVHDLVYRFAGETMHRGARWTKAVFQGRSVRRAARVVAVSHTTANDVTQFYGRHPDAVIKPPIQRAFVRRSPADVGDALARHGVRRPYWMFAGTLEPRKNLVNMLRAYLQACRNEHSPPTLVLAGASGWHDASLNALIADGERAKKLRRLGYVTADDLACLYSGCQALWMPSTYEGFGMPLLEAQRCGAPVVHGTHASMFEASAGLGVETGTDVAALARTMGSIARGEAPLTCRLVDHPADQTAAAASCLWECFRAACKASLP